jgi:tRNA pseudouridine55 synthase
MATGLLIVGLGKGTKQLAGFLKQDKTYEATIILGLSTETGDIDGRIVREVSATDIEEKQVQKAIQTMVGALDLPVPLFSAIKKNGKALYKHAYRGNPENIVPPMRTMRVYDVEYFGMTKKGNTVEIHARFDVGSGVYVRSLAEELGRRLAVPATLGALRRTKVGMYKIKDAVLPGDVY